jgi:hypothetical protein
MLGKIAVFRLYKTNLRLMDQFCKKFYGQETTSHKGKYRYRRMGLLDQIPHRKLIRGVIIIPLEYEKEVVDFLGNFNAECWVRKVELTSEDVEALEAKK